MCVRTTRPELRRKPSACRGMERTRSPITDSSEESSNEEDSKTDSLRDPAIPHTTGFSSMSFEEIMRVQNKVGTKAFYKMARAAREGKSPGDSKRQPEKNRPMEISSKKAVPFLRRVVPVRTAIRRDPRFDDLSGEFKPEVFEKTYGFLDGIKNKEKEDLEKQLKKSRNPELKEQLKQLLERMNQQEEAAKKKQKLREKEAEFKRQQRERAQQGKKPYYLKKSDVRKLDLAHKYQDLKKKGKVENFLSKKRKRNSIKDRRRLPSLQ